MSLSDSCGAFVKRNPLAGGFLLATMLSLVWTNPAYSGTSIPGDSCAPANLSQALGLGLGYSQFGVTNNAAIGAGSFFVSCPITMVEDDDSFDSVSLEVQYLSPLAQNITCVIIVVETQVDPLVAHETQVLAVDTNPGTNIGQFELTDTTGLPVGNGVDKVSIVCAMPPQTRITHFNINGT
jgi:hypothetical protein